ncbi:uncharacterized protein CLUP02_03119 [Colletotrichum lupini]|uniref:Uncharacterized protein n=1 Tax=Colletotrichum lupini TaxID=145971 RepID=A0A9Q8SIM2_9PEZI|nr:uncharacterized protein CLUP02_03119 [Colletotrichum lupini]UQC77650.1 hypothetical protein CLUP02_03119 [Colletotrichum lupini]
MLIAVVPRPFLPEKVMYRYQFVLFGLFIERAKMIYQLATTRLEVCKALDALPYLSALSFGSGIDKAGALSPLKDYTKADRLPFHTDLNPPLGPVMGAASFWRQRQKVTTGGREIHVPFPTRKPDADHQSPEPQSTLPYLTPYLLLPSDDGGDGGPARRWSTSGTPYLASLLRLAGPSTSYSMLADVMYGVHLIFQKYRESLLCKRKKRPWSKYLRLRGKQPEVPHLPPPASPRLNSRLLSCICSLHLLACVALLVPEHTKTLQTKGQPPKGPFHHQASQLTYPLTPPLVSLFFPLSHSHTPHLQPHPQTPYPFLQASSSSGGKDNELVFAHHTIPSSKRLARPKGRNATHPHPHRASQQQQHHQQSAAPSIHIDPSPPLKATRPQNGYPSAWQEKSFHHPQRPIFVHVHPFCNRPTGWPGVPCNTWKHAQTRPFNSFNPSTNIPYRTKAPTTTPFFFRAPLLCSALRLPLLLCPPKLDSPTAAAPDPPLNTRPEETLGTDAAPCRHPPSKPPTVEYETLRSRSCPQFIGSISPPRLSTVDRESIAQFVNDSNPLGKF